MKTVGAGKKFETLHRLIQRINEIMNYSINVGYMDINKLNKVHMIFESQQAKHLLSIRPEELPEFMKALSKAQIKPCTKLLIEFQLLTLARPIEAVQVEWSEIDFVKRIWTVPEEKIKKNREHLVPLSQRAIDILLEMKKINGNRKYVFNSQVKKHLNKHMSSQTANVAIKRMGYSGKLVSHGLRSVASTYLNEQSFDKEIIEIALSHIDKNTVRRAYNRSLYLEQRTEMLNCWAEFVRFAKIGKVLQFNKQKSTNPKPTVNFTSNYSNTSNMSKISYSMNLTA
ncbi:tyrosine-type recombinase/integrase [Gilliamella sp. ESL0405]|uniref:tyrosine-type recombinase/integrase n=1 Tax=Gilliamella sp. ESL0405 TaxID=2704653 RepID=UPI001C69FFA2|nr:tyrosine-type recombinase/integrase [Gilliamella sp. ESL0405]QYN46112.1 tyrosine-type recombinase/integrase [Gilliamella sp. ESL0405]